MSADELMVLALACLMIAVGLAFKLSAVPFHFWCPDVFEGATAEIGGFLSVASKAAALALLVRVVIGIRLASPRRAFMPGERTAAAAAQAVAAAGRRDPGCSPSVDASSPARDARPAVAADDRHRRPHQRRPATQVCCDVRYFMSRLIALLAIVTCTFGNLAAYGQTNIKRMLAYSTIAHAGYMMMAVPPLLELVGTDVGRAPSMRPRRLAIYISVYLFLNLGAFAIVAFLRNRMQSEQIADYAGLLRRCPGVAICFSLILLGLVGFRRFPGSWASSPSLPL